MTDVPGLDDHHGEASDVPLPLPAPVCARRRTGVWITLGTVALLVACGAIAWGLSVVIEDLAVEGVGLSDDESVVSDANWWADTATWTEDGRYAVVQTRDADGLPQVVVVDTETDAVRTESGAYVAVMESGAPVLWLIRLTESDWNDPGTLLPGMGFVDGPPSALEVWDLADEDGRPSDRAPARWHRVVGSAGWDAYLEVDVLRGAFPSKLLFNNAEASGEGHAAQLPDDFGTFEFLGFSPSGEYVAVVELERISSETSARQRLLMIRAEDGSIAAERVFDYPHGETIVWDPSGDRLVWATMGYDTETREYARCRLPTMSADGVERDALDVWGCEDPPGWADIQEIAVVGVDASDEKVYLMATIGDTSRILTVGPKGSADEGALSWGEAWPDFSAESGFVQLEYEWPQDDACRDLLVLYDAVGGGRAVLWQGPLLTYEDEWGD